MVVYFHGGKNHLVKNVQFEKGVVKRMCKKRKCPNKK